MNLHKAILPILFAVSFTGIMKADGSQELRKYFSDVAIEVKELESPAQKRALLNNSFDRMKRALDLAQQSPLLDENDRNGIPQLQRMIAEKQNELNGAQGFDRVSDVELNNFADYVVQDMEQAQQYVTISITALLLIVLIVLLIAR